MVSRRKIWFPASALCVVLRPAPRNAQTNWGFCGGLDRGFAAADRAFAEIPLHCVVVPRGHLSGRAATLGSHSCEQAKVGVGVGALSMIRSASSSSSSGATSSVRWSRASAPGSRRLAVTWLVLDLTGRSDRRGTRWRCNSCRSSACFQSINTLSVQQATEPSMQGRVMALHQIAWNGNTPLGALAMGWVLKNDIASGAVLAGRPRGLRMRVGLARAALSGATRPERPQGSSAQTILVMAHEYGAS